jgi:hypothetical protein
MAAEVAALNDPNDLGEVAEMVEDRFGRAMLINQLVDAADWDGRHFNLVHLAIALLYAEGILQVGFTANWDRLAQRAARTIAGLDLSCPCDKQTLAVAKPPLFVHLHGAAEHPGSLVATNRHLMQPEAIEWTQPQLAAATLVHELVLIGFAAEPAYVLTTIESALAATAGTLVAVLSLSCYSDFVATSPDLARVTGVDADPDLYVEGTATERVGDALRVCYAHFLRDLLDEGERQAREVALPLGVTSQGVDRVRDALLGGTLADLLGLLWRAAQLPADLTAEERQPTFATSGVAIAQALATIFLLSSCRDVTGLEARREGLRISLQSGGFADLWIVVPGTAVGTPGAIRRASLNSGRFAYPGDDAIPLILVCARTLGLPSTTAPAFLAGSPVGGTIVSPLRIPTDAITLEELDRRRPTAGAGRFEDFVRLAP